MKNLPFTLLILASAPSLADGLTAPSAWGPYPGLEGNYGSVIETANIYTIPDEYLNEHLTDTSGLEVWVTIYDGPGCAGVNIGHGKRTTYDGTLKESFQSGALWKDNNEGAWTLIWDKVSGAVISYTIELGRLDGSVHNPIIWGPGECASARAEPHPATCAIADGTVLLDHGVVKLGSTSTVSNTVTVTCTSKGSGRLALAGGGDTIPVGGGRVP